jgi:hypothetical protein
MMNLRMNLSVPDQLGSSLVRVARFPGLRALAWAGNQLYASRGYDLLCATIQNPNRIEWNLLGRFSPALPRRLSVTNRLSARLFRDGFHALAVLSSGAMVAAIPGAIITLHPGETEFHATHSIARGTRPLHITAVPGGAVYWGEYFDNAQRDEVHIYASHDGGATWNVAHTFPKDTIRHVHNIVYDPHENCLWVLTGDYGEECRILRADCDFSKVESVLQGNQQARTVALVPMKDGLYFSTDTPLEQNYIYRLDRARTLTQLAPISSSSIYGCQAAERIFFSTMVEPSEVNRDHHVRIYGSGAATHRVENWQPLLAWKKDRWPMTYFQYGNAFLPDGDNSTQFLAVSTVAINEDDLTTSLYSLE